MDGRTKTSMWKPSITLKKAILFSGTGISLVLGLFVIVSSRDTRPSDNVLRAGLKAFARYGSVSAGQPYMILVNYTLPFFKKRLWVIERKTNRTILTAHVSHAWNSGFFYATAFSNTPETQRSCAGAFLTREAYQGRFGLSMRIVGLEKGINENAESRAIVFHASYLPWTFGCFATFPRVNKRIIGLTKNRAFLYVHKEK
jgi:hypothetical protein